MQQRRAAHCGSDASRLAGLRVGPRALGRPRPSSSGSSSTARAALRSSRSAGPLRVAAMQGGWSPQPLQPQQQPQQPLQPQQPVRQSAPLARQQYAAAPVFLELSQVLNKQVVTRTSGRSLGSISGAWLDPSRGAVVSFDLDERRSGPGGVAGRGLSTPARAGNIPLSALRQIGDVVLVHDEAGLYEPDLDGRLGFVNPLGLGVRTAAGEFLGKVRDLSFSPDSGAIARITYDEFGLPFLPLSFFDCYSVALADVLSIGRADLIVYDDAKYRERKESAGLFAAIPSLLKSLNAPRLASPQLALPAAGGTSDMYRLGAGAAAGGGGRYLPADYTYEQWQADLRRWEAETGMTYEQYLRSQPPQQQAAAPRTALPPGRTAPAQAGYAAAGAYGQGAYAAPQQQQQQQQRPQPGYGQAPQQQQMQQPQQPQYGQAYGQQQMRPQQMPVQQQQQQQPRYAGQPAAGAAWGAAAPQQAPGAGQQFAAGGFNPVTAGGAAAAGGAPGMAGLQQQRGQQQQPLQQQSLQQQSLQQQSPRRGQVQPLQQQQQQPQTRAAGAAPVGAARTTAPRAAPAAAPQQPQQAQQASSQQQQQQQQVGLRVDEWMVRETRPRIADALADGVLPLTEEAAAAENTAAAGGQAQQQPQEVL